jgi:hypothetical protein
MEGQIVTRDGQGDLLGFGVAIGGVIAGLTFLLHEPRTPHSKTMSKRRPGQRPADRLDSNPQAHCHLRPVRAQVSPRSRGCRPR